MEKILNKIWYNKLNLISLILTPFSLVFYLVIKIRKALYTQKILKTHKFSTPIIIIGNLTVGGTGKTPLTIWLCNYLLKKGLKVGIVSSGYKSEAKNPQLVKDDAAVEKFGDEAILIYKKTKVPVITGGNRINATKKMENENNLDLIIHDDGLQHYALHRNLEILVIDQKRKLGNEFLLPAGPLREPKERLKSVDLVVRNNSKDTRIPSIETNNNIIYPETSEITSLDKFTNTTIHLVAGIGSMEGIKSELEQHKIKYIMHTYPDHHSYTGKEILFDDNLPIFTTEKDFVKLSMYNKKLWVLQLSITPNKKFLNNLDIFVKEIIKNES